MYPSLARKIQLTLLLAALVLAAPSAVLGVSPDLFAPDYLILAADGPDGRLMVFTAEAELLGEPLDPAYVSCDPASGTTTVASGEMRTFVCQATDPDSDDETTKAFQVAVVDGLPPGADVPDGLQAGRLTSGSLRQELPSLSPRDVCGLNLWIGKRSDGLGNFGTWAVQLHDGRYRTTVLQGNLASQTENWQRYRRASFTVPSYLRPPISLHITGSGGVKAFDLVDLRCGGDNLVENASFETPVLNDGEWLPAQLDPPPGQPWGGSSGGGFLNPEAPQFEGVDAATAAEQMFELGFGHVEIAIALASSYFTFLADSFEDAEGPALEAATGITQILADLGFSTDEVAEGLHAANVSAPAAGGSLLEIFYALEPPFPVGDRATVCSIAEILHQLYADIETADFLSWAGLERDSCPGVDLDLPPEVSELTGEHASTLAERFAPRLRFDLDPRGFPMSAQEYFELKVAPWDEYTSEEPVQDNDDTPDGVPTYYQVFESEGQVRILYRFFYGNQPGCLLGEGEADWNELLNNVLQALGSLDFEGIAEAWGNFASAALTDPGHQGDWERMIVTLSEDETRIAAVTFYQHSGWYTRLPGNADLDHFLPFTDWGSGFETAEDTHPVAYVGRNSHGSFHWSAGFLDELSTPTCLYFGDWRRTNGSSQILDTWSNLVPMARDLEAFPENGGYAEPWMAEVNDDSGSMRWMAAAGQTQFVLGENSTPAEGRRTMVPHDTVSVYLNDQFECCMHLATSDNEACATASDVCGPRARMLDDADGDVLELSTPPGAGTEVRIDYARTIRWGWSGCEGHSTCDEMGGTTAVATDPYMEGEEAFTLAACSGFGVVGDGIGRPQSGCTASQCQYKDNQFGGFGPFDTGPAGICFRCPKGFTDFGAFCGDLDGWPWEWRIRSYKPIGLNYKIPARDEGLLKHP